VYQVSSIFILNTLSLLVADKKIAFDNFALFWNMPDRRTWTREEIVDFIPVAKETILVTESHRNKRNMDLFLSVQ